jgi:hypothetical protein
MQVDYESLKKSIDDLDLNNISRVQYRSREYWINPTSAPGEGKPAQWFKSTSCSGADVYLWETIEPEFKKAMVLHEIIEADLKVHQRVPEQVAHDVAREHDERYVKETLNEFILRLYNIKKAHMEIAFEILSDAA